MFQPAVLLGACSVLIAHNHPAGDPAPSEADLAVTERLALAGRLLGIELVDHFVWTRAGECVSLRGVGAL